MSQCINVMKSRCGAPACSTTSPRAFEAKVTKLVGGLSTASATMETTAQSMSSTPSATNRQAGVVATASEQTSTSVPTVASATEELTSSISEIARQATQSTEIAARAVDNAAAAAIPRVRWPRARRRQKIGDKNVVDVITEIDQIGIAFASAIEEQGSATREISRGVQEAARGTQEVNANISGVQRAADDTGSAANQVLGAAEQHSSQSRDLAGQFNRFLSEVRAA